MEKKQFQEEFDEARIYYDSLLDRDLFSLFKKSQLTLSIAEGYTGGLISQRISKFHGSHTFFKAGLISADIKTQIKLFNISPSVIRKHGLNSIESINSILESLNKIYNTDICIANIGTKHNDNTTEESCFFGIKINNEIKTKQLLLSGGLETKRKTVIQSSLSILKTSLQNKVLNLQTT